MLTIAVQKFNGKNWKKIAELVPHRTDVQCLHRWQKVLNPDLVKGPWSKEEDDIIFELVEKQGKKKWSEIAKDLPGRIGKQCRERWCNHLNPDIKKSAWTEEEELILIRAHGMYGNQWAKIAKLLPGRTENSIKNLWNCSVRKKVELLAASQINVGNHGTSIDFYAANDLIRPSSSNDHAHDPSTQNHQVHSCNAPEPENCSIRVGFFSYESLQRKDLNTYRTTGESPDTDGYVGTASSPASILRNAAKGFKNIPSIIRKRSSQTRTKSGNGNAKELFPSPTKSPKLDTTDAVRSVEKNVGYAFDGIVRGSSSNID
ncbi:putative Acyl-CoA thioesterase [Hibiscus syriacus]|uniref:Acyl-CoA thioesterase n=1 Tax=Hibiscus syriacus TaxID=106335 RepID=A0A6A3C012_HIBSY|nr:transcription factor MYB3R-3-like [Hibiscus syriacus]KAE8722154.1 putative Acyl-CoA thioesterase [Hibiscus syriacus]